MKAVIFKFQVEGTVPKCVHFTSCGIKNYYYK